MGFFKTSLAVATGILGAIGIIVFTEHLNESGAFDKVKARVNEAVATANKNKKTDEEDATN